MKISNHISRFGLLLDDESSVRPTLLVKPDSRLVTNNVTRPNFVLSVLTHYNESCKSLTKSLHNCERLGITKLWNVSKSQHRVTKNTSWTVAISCSTFIAFIDATYVEWQAFRVDSHLPVTQLSCGALATSYEASLRMLWRLDAFTRGPAAAPFAAVIRSVSSGSVDITAPLNFWASQRRSNQEKGSRENVYEPATGKLTQSVTLWKHNISLCHDCHSIKWTLTHAVRGYSKTRSCEACHCVLLCLVVRIWSTLDYFPNTIGLQTHSFHPLHADLTEQIIWVHQHSSFSSQLLKHYGLCKGHVESPAGPS